MRKRPKNLLLSPEAVRRGEDYCQDHGTTLSRLVGDFLMALPSNWLPDPSQARSPIVRRLIGAASNAPFTTDTYRDYLYQTARAKTRDSF